MMSGHVKPKYVSSNAHEIDRFGFSRRLIYPSSQIIEVEDAPVKGT